MSPPALVVALLLAAAPASPPRSPLVRELGEAEVDWEKGVVTTRAGAAAEIELPGPDSARPAAQRAAEKRARAQLGAALGLLPLGPGRRLSKAKAEAAAGKARVAQLELQSNGGVLLELAWDFAALAPDDAPAREVILAVPSMPLEVAPEVLAGGVEQTLGAAVYRAGEPPAQALPAKRDKRGRLVIAETAADARTLAELEGARATIYVRSVAKK